MRFILSGIPPESRVDQGPAQLGVSVGSRFGNLGVAYQLALGEVVTIEGATDDQSSLTARLLIGNDEVEFSIDNVDEDSDVIISPLSEKVFFVNVWHRQRPAPCIVRCADGTVGQPCVTCRKGNRVVRICC
ncbi:MAG TPA: hypothetical protein VF547_09500 [Allosphingosinicella sp.]|jgi:hypothetical protein